MPKVLIDQKLADTLKTMRIERGVLSKTISEKLGKSASYISKLESGSIKSIDYIELISYIQIIVGQANEDYIEELIKTANYKYSSEEIENLLWMDNFDLIYRKIPVPLELLTEINGMMENNGITLIQLVDQINKNEFLPESIRNDTKQSYNIWFMVNNVSYIKMQLKYKEMEEMLNGNTKKENYTFLRATVQYLFRLIDYRYIEDYNITKEQGDSLRVKTIKYLEKFKIYTSVRKQQLITEAQSAHELEEKLSRHDTQNMKILRDTFEALVFYSEYDIEDANILINNFRKNMNWDSPFIMEIAGMDFSQLGTCSHRIKQNIIDQIRTILEDTLKIPEEQRKMEKYQ